VTVDAKALLAEVESWSPKAQAEFADRLSKVVGTERRIWYCTRGRSCTGEPHEGVPYNHARSDQWPPAGNDWFVWFLRGGRGSGKTRTASEFVRYSARYVPYIACVGIDVRKIRQTMIEGRSGLIRICEYAGIDYTWEPSKREFTFESGPGAGAKAIMYSAEEPDHLRSPEHGLAWLDEPSHYALIDDVWSNLKFGLRVPGMPGGAKVIATSTPLPNKWTKDISNHPRTRLSVVSTYRNLANLDPAFREAVLEEYEGTRLGRQELYGEILEDVEGALWRNDMIRYVPESEREEAVERLDRIVIAIDPAGSVDRKRDETGLVAVGRWQDDRAQHRYLVLEDASGHYSPNGWAERAIQMAEKWGAERIIAERNYGGNMVENTIKTADPTMRVQTVHSRRGKALRAEPVVAKYEQGKVLHLEKMEGLEAQQTSWVPAQSPSPDRVDALVHGLTGLGLSPRPGKIATPSASQIASLFAPRR